MYVVSAGFCVQPLGKLRFDGHGFFGVGVVADEQRHPKGVGAAGRDLRFGGVEVLHFGEIVRDGEHAVKGPRAAELKCGLAIFRCREKRWADMESASR